MMRPGVAITISERDDVLLQVIDDAPRRGNNDIDAVLEHLALLVVVDAAVDEG